MRRIRRRRQRVFWLPTFGGTTDGEDFTAPFPGIEGRLNGPSDGTVTWDAFPVTYDQTASPDPTGTEQPTLQDIASGNQWSLRRIVGKIFVSANASIEVAVPGNAVAVEASAGFIVCKTDDEGTPLTDFTQVNPLSRYSMEDPWIWRRTWMLSPWGAPQVTGTSGNITASYGFGFQGWPMCNAGYGSVMDGPHIDSKVNRRIDREESLFFMLALRASNPTYSGILAGTVGITYHLDYRLLGILRPKAVGNRYNASR